MTENEIMLRVIVGGVIALILMTILLERNSDDCNK